MKKGSRGSPSFISNQQRQRIAAAPGDQPAMTRAISRHLFE
ncbi:MAG: hypothetical protein RL489_2248 [Pseudomonadota bacterium]|jgi:hypothetical protein